MAAGLPFDRASPPVIDTTTKRTTMAAMYVIFYLRGTVLLTAVLVFLCLCIVSVTFSLDTKETLKTFFCNIFCSITAAY